MLNRDCADLRWGEARARAGMSTFKDNTDDGFVALNNRVFYSKYQRRAERTACSARRF